MTKVLIGSHAASLHFPSFPREVKDIDYFSTEKIAGSDGKGRKMESFWHDRLAEWGWNDVATPDELYTIKLSHIFWDNPGWEKHIYDAMWLKNAGCKLIPELHTLLYSIWEEKFGKKPANLNKTPEEFFTSTVKRVYDHDSIHDSIAYGDEPLYKAILKDGHGVAVDRQKFEALSTEDKLNLVREECYATALERILIPAGYHSGPTHAYRWALKKLITSFSKGWFALYVAENYDVLRSPDVDYVQRHRDNSERLIRL